MTQSANVLYDYAMTNLQTTGEQTRYVELRYEGERVINGTLMRYGDTAEFPWGDKERFEPGVFGDIGKVDFTLDKQHERGRTMARTQGGGVTLNDSLSTLEMRADLPNTTDANDTLELVRAKVLRGLSITFRAIDYGLERNKDGSTTIVHKRAELRGGGVVDRPQYKQSTLREQVRGMVEMEDTQVRALVAELLAQNRQDPKPEPVPAEAIAAAISAEVKTRFEALDLSGVVSTAVEESLSKRALAEEAAAAVVAAEAEVAKAAAEAAAAAQTPEDADARAELILSVKSLLPKDFETRGKTNHEILVAAAGEEVERADERADAYLLAKVEGIIERRESVATRNSGASAGTPAGAGNYQTAGTGPVNLNRLVEQKRMAAK